MRFERLPVEKIDPDGNVLGRYDSMKQAAKENFISLTSVYKRCRGEVKKPFELMGFSFRYKKRKGK